MLIIGKVSWRKWRVRERSTRKSQLNFKKEDYEHAKFWSGFDLSLSLCCSCLFFPLPLPWMLTGVQGMDKTFLSLFLHFFTCFCWCEISVIKHLIIVFYCFCCRNFGDLRAEERGNDMLVCCSLLSFFCFSSSIYVCGNVQVYVYIYVYIILVFAGHQIQIQEIELSTFTTAMPIFCKNWIDNVLITTHIDKLDWK